MSRALPAASAALQTAASAALLVVLSGLLIGCPATVRPGGDPTPDRPTMTLAAVESALDRGDLAAAVVAHREQAGRPGTPETLRAWRELEEVLGYLTGGPAPDRRVYRRHVTLARTRALLPSLTGMVQIRARTRLALAALHRGDDDALDTAVRLRDELGAEAPAGLERAIDASVQLGLQKKGRIGVLLPLSGPYRQIGEAARRAIELAVGKRRYRRLLVRDTRGDSHAAARLVDELAKDGAVAILGPVGAHESTAAAARAAELGIPLLALSAREELAQVAGDVFRTRLSAGRQGYRLARYAWSEMRLKRVALLISDTPYGWALAGAFQDELLALGGTIPRMTVYPRGSADVRGIVRQLAGGERGRRHVDFDAILVADDYRAVRRFAPFFGYWGFPIKTEPGGRGVQLLGGSGFNHPLFVDQAERTTENAVFTDSFYPDGSDSRIHAFVTSFYKRYREPPSPFEAEAYDAAGLLWKVVARHGRSRDAVRSGLAELKSYRGVTGTMRFDDRGDVIKDARMLTVDGDGIRVRHSEAEERAVRRAQP